MRPRSEGLMFERDLYINDARNKLSSGWRARKSCPMAEELGHVSGSTFLLTISQGATITTTLKDFVRAAMIQLKTMVNVIDNSGAAIAECIQVLRSKRPAKIGDRIIVVVQKQRNFGPESGPGGGVSVSAANKVRRGDIRHAIVVRTAKRCQRPDGSAVSFADNACVLIGKNGEPVGTRLNSIVGQELRGRQWSKILSLAPMHV